MQPELEVEAVSPPCTSQPGAAPTLSEVLCSGWEMSPEGDILPCVPDLRAGLVVEAGTQSLCQEPSLINEVGGAGLAW